ncbi:tRNA(Met) cytidine acetyltransferase TmcA [Marinobacter sp. M1N3S26]|uniref:tRNA(Met) cytidine acetyltransferase TmcA n=1 Tax=Marinobacter sp. M1N3S26 TaxID=3382299 RepID=UPI00387B3534
MSHDPWQTLASQLAVRGERRLVLIEGGRDQAVACVRRILGQLGPSAGLWVGSKEDNPHASLDTLAAGQIRQRLGTETPVVVWDGWQGNPPDALAAITGTLVAGGLWFWLMPPLDQWGSYPDPDHARMGLPEDGHHPFLARLARIIDASPSVIRCAANSDDVPSPPSIQNHENAPFRVTGTPDQDRAIEAIMRTGQGRRRRPLVITADRGRGKSAALGMAATRLLQGGRERILVVSPRKDNVATLFRHAAREAGLDHQEQTRLQLACGATLEWLPIDDLLARRPEAELIMVDEAAAIPAPLLRQVLLGWPRVVFSTTVHGYEGSGRGFNLRFRAVLDRETPHWQSLTLRQPVRWADSDPLEPLVNRLFLLDAENPGAEAGEDITIESWRPDEASEATLAQAFGLLVDAHYRTTPSDLRQWMDDPKAMTFVARRQGAIVGVLWATVEGGLEPALADQVLRGERRLKGHLLPQSLANHGGDAQAATLRMLRVVRVAVHDGRRRQGIGQRLLAAVTEKAETAGLDAIGTSFGAAVELLPFWQSAGFATVRLGISREASSGEYAVQMLRGLSEAGKAAQQRLSSRFAEQWPVLLPVIWASLSAELVLAISADLPPAPPLADQEITELEAFAHGHRGFELTLPALKRLTVQTDVSRQLSESIGAPLWIHGILQNQSWHGAREQGLCSGKRDGESQLRQLAADLLFRGALSSANNGKE